MLENTTNPTLLTATDGNPQDTPQSKLSTPATPSPFYKKKLFLLVVFLFLIIGIASGTLYYFKNLPNDTITNNTTPLPVKNAQSTIPAPTFNAQRFTYAGSLPQVKSLSTYILKSNFTQSEVSSFAANLKLENLTTPDSNGDIYASSNETASRGILVFNTKSGSFSYQSYGEFIPQNYKPQTPTLEAVSLLETLGIYDPTISCDITYKNNALEGVTFVECHRMWTALNAPLLNLGGTLNIPENTKISSLTPGKVTANSTPTNPDIIAVSNGGNGLERPSQFNTITVGLFPDGSIHSITSTVRHLKQTVAITPDEIITPQEALDYFKKNKGTLTLTIPTGSGVVDWNKVYPGNTANADIAAIDEVTPAFLDKPLTNSQDSYEPYYLIRGTAKLTSGYTVLFTQSIPAQKSKLTANLQSIAESKDAMQLETFTLPPTTAITQPPNTSPELTTTPLSTTPTTRPDLPISTPAPTGPAVYTACGVGVFGDTLINLAVPGYGNLTVAVHVGTQVDNSGHTYHFVTNKVMTPGPEFNNIRAAFFRAVQEQYAVFAARAMLDGRAKPRVINPFQISALSRQPTTSPSEVLEKLKKMGSGGRGDESIVPDCDDTLLSKGNQCFQKDTYKSVAQKTLEQVVAAQNNGALATLAAKPNLFPEKTISTFSWVFYYYGGNNPLPADYKVKEGEQISCYISGESPHIFISSKEGKNVSIETRAKLTYSDPIATNKKWQGTIKNNIFTSSDNVTRSSIYYEYDPKNVNFSEPKEGYITTRSHILEVVEIISNKLGLQTAETQALISDTQNALADIPQAKYVKLSLIAKHELDSQLPLGISPKPENITRIHLMLSQVETPYSLPEPAIKKVKRSNFSVLEIGAYTR